MLVSLGVEFVVPFSSCSRPLALKAIITKSSNVALVKTLSFDDSLMTTREQEFYSHRKKEPQIPSPTLKVNVAIVWQDWSQQRPCVCFTQFTPSRLS